MRGETEWSDGNNIERRNEIHRRSRHPRNGIQSRCLENSISREWKHPRTVNYAKQLPCSRRLSREQHPRTVLHEHVCNAGFRIVLRLHRLSACIRELDRVTTESISARPAL